MAKRGSGQDTGTSSAVVEWSLSILEAVIGLLKKVGDASFMGDQESTRVASRRV
jgi:hypothetical protein